MGDDIADAGLRGVLRVSDHAALQSEAAEHAVEAALKGPMKPLNRFLALAFIGTSLGAAAGDPAGKIPPQQPLVTANADGTVTVQKAPINRKSNDPKAKNGLVIPPQVVVPIAAPREEKSKWLP